MTQIDRYLARLILIPLLGTLALAAMLLLLDRMLRLFDFVVAEGGPVTIVWRMLANLVPEYLGLAIPVGLTLGVLLAFRKLALSSELDSLRGAGLSYGRLLRVPYLYALALLGINLAMVGYVQPFAQYEYQSLRFELRSGPRSRSASSRGSAARSRSGSSAARIGAPTCTACSFGWFAATAEAWR